MGRDFGFSAPETCSPGDALIESDVGLGLAEGSQFGIGSGASAQAGGGPQGTIGRGGARDEGNDGRNVRYELHYRRRC